jgi:predicted GNAT family N-acyltransferase
MTAFDPQSSHHFTYEVAEGKLAAEAVRFYSDIYRRDLGRIPPDSYDSVATHFLARGSAGQVVAACRLLGPSTRPFDFEHLVSLAELLPSNARPGLVGRLCVHPQYRNIAVSLPIQYGLIGVLVGFSRSIGVTDLILYTYDNLRSLYRVGGFEDTTVSFSHQFWGVVRLMRRKLDDNLT